MKRRITAGLMSLGLVLGAWALQDGPKASGSKARTTEVQRQLAAERDYRAHSLEFGK